MHSFHKKIGRDYPLLVLLRSNDSRVIANSFHGRFLNYGKLFSEMIYESEFS